MKYLKEFVFYVTAAATTNVNDMFCYRFFTSQNGWLVKALRAAINCHHQQRTQRKLQRQPNDFQFFCRFEFSENKNALNAQQIRN